MVEDEKSLDENIEDILRNESADDVMETVWLTVYFRLHKELSEEVEKLIYEKVKKYVTEEGFPNKGINKEDIIREIVNILFRKTIAPVIEQRETTHDLFVDFLKNYKAQEIHGKGATMQAGELSEAEIERLFGEITAKEKGEKNE